jgi:cardiolipin synthase
LRRLHRKLVAVDGAVAFVGGINVNADTRAEDGHTMPRLDFAVRLEGRLAQEIQAVMMRLWNSVTWASSSFRSEQLVALIRHRPPAVRLPDLQLLLRDNVRHRREIERAYLRAMSTAQHEVLIANAYFLPGLAFRRALIQAARRGVRVALLLQGKVEYRLQHYATRALYDDLLDAGVEIYEYQASYLHAKVAVIDERWSTVGSSNIDPFSLLLAREANLLIYDAGFSLELKADLMAAIAHNALRIEPARWRRLGWFARLRSHVSYAVIRMLVGVLGHPRSGL